MKKFIFLLFILISIVSPQSNFTDPIFDLQKIMNEPLDVKIIKSIKKENIVIQEIEFTSEFYQEKPIRIYGIIAFPEDAKNLPAIFWSMPGMYPANIEWPEFFAKRGYVCMCITLPHSTWQPFTAFNTKDPKDGNLTHYAIAQMRAITYLTTIPQVNPEKIGIGGSSYGGFFATLIAGADPRIKCGMSFFAGGNLSYGTNRPEFNKMESEQDVEIWNKTIDPALRLKFRKVPFLWGIAANDHWDYLPALIKTYEDSIGEKRIAIVPMWSHAFPEEIDEQLFSWFDIYLKKSRKPYNEVSDLSIVKKKDRLFAKWSFSGENKVKKAELVVSYGKVSPWKYWTCRNHIVFPAEVKENTAIGEIPVVEPYIEMLVYGNIIDENDVLISTIPVHIKAIDYGIKKANCKTKFNLFQWKIFDHKTEINFKRIGITGFIFDYHTKKNGMPSLKVDPSKTNPVSLQLHHVPERAHKLKMWVKAEKLTEINISVKALELPNSHYPIVRILRKQTKNNMVLPVYSKTFTVDGKWKFIEIDCPYINEDIEGYVLLISSSQHVPYWINSIIFEPVWKK